jgi:hypothetical protein
MQTIDTRGDRFRTAYHKARRQLGLGPGRFDNVLLLAARRLVVEDAFSQGHLPLCQSNNFECTRCGRSGSIVEEAPNEFGTNQFSVTGTITTEACS